MPALNEERTISQVLDTVLASPVDLEVILVDDGSTDRTWELMQARARADPRVRAFRSGHRIYEVPIGYAARSRAEGEKLTAMDGVRAIVTLIRDRGWRPGADPR
jgi:glycosyltransferase involved in cell wall biosynthesis